MKKSVFCLLLAVAWLWARPASVHVPLDYWGYNFLERMETRGLIESSALRARPITRDQFAELLRTIPERSAKMNNPLSRVEQRQLEQVQGDFYNELNRSFFASSPERHLLSWQENKSGLYLDLYGKESIISNRGGQYQPEQLLSETAVGGILRGTLNQSIGFYLDARNALTRGGEVPEEENFDPSKGSPTVISGSNVFQDRALAYWTWQSSWLQLALGRDEFQWGPGWHAGLSISGNMPATEMIRLSSTFKRFRFTYLHAFLRSGLGAKYLAGHRIDYTLKPGLYIGATETVIYGKRDVEFAYLNPIMPFHVAQHHLGDKDNKTISVDLTTTLLTGSKFYFEYFIDDMTSSESLTRYYGNKFAFLAGVQWSNPLRLQNVDIRLEHSHVEPFVYSHWDSINIYSNYDQLIGHWLGPNGECTILQTDWQISRDLRLECSLEQQRKGDGAADTRSKPESGTIKHFLSGVVEKKRLAGLKVVDQIRRDVFVSLHYTYADVRNTGHQPGRTTFNHLARFELYVNY